MYHNHFFISGEIPEQTSITPGFPWPHFLWLFHWPCAILSNSACLSRTLRSPQHCPHAPPQPLTAAERSPRPPAPPHEMLQTQLVLLPSHWSQSASEAPPHINLPKDGDLRVMGDVSLALLPTFSDSPCCVKPTIYKLPIYFIVGPKNISKLSQQSHNQSQMSHSLSVHQPSGHSVLKVRIPSGYLFPSLKSLDGMPHLQDEVQNPRHVIKCLLRCGLCWPPSSICALSSRFSIHQLCSLMCLSYACFSPLLGMYSLHPSNLINTHAPWSLAWVLLPCSTFWEASRCSFLPHTSSVLSTISLKVAQSCPTLCNPMDYTVHGILQARILEWVAFPSSRGSSQPTEWIGVFCTAGGFFTSWASREDQEYWSGQPISSPVALPDPGIELGSSALQMDLLPNGKGSYHITICLLFFLSYWIGSSPKGKTILYCWNVYHWHVAHCPAHSSLQNIQNIRNHWWRPSVSSPTTEVPVCLMIVPLHLR